MPRTTNDPALITTLTNGQTIANGGTTPSEAGVTLTVALSGSGSVTFDDDRYVCTGSASVARLDQTLSSFGLVQVEDLWDIPSAPTGSANRIYEFRHASNFSCRVEQNTSRTLVVLNSANTAIWTSAAVPLGEVRIRVTLDPDPTTAGNGDFQIDIFSTNPRTSTTPDQTWSTTASDFTVNALTAVRRGRVSSTAGSNAVVELIYAQTEDSLTPIGPYNPVTGATVNAVCATATALAEPPAVAAEVVVASSGPATATALASPPVVTGGAVVTAVRATASALATPPTVTTGANLTAVRATATAASGTPVATGGATVTAVVATASALATPPTVQASSASTVVAVTATATAAAGTPTIATGANITAVRATATAAAGTPTVSVSATVVSVRATATAAAGTPAASGGANVAAVKATAMSVAYAPGATGGAIVSATVTTAAAGAWAPTVEGRGLLEPPVNRFTSVTYTQRVMSIIEN